MARSTNMIIPEILEDALFRKSAEITDVFNASSGGAITLISDPTEQKTSGGDFTEPVRIKRAADLITRADDINPTNTATVVSITQGQGKRVRLDQKIGPAKFTDNEVLRGFKTPKQYSQALGEMFASEMLVTIRNLGISAAVAGVEAADTTDGTTSSANIHINDFASGPVATGAAVATQARVNQLLNKMADARGRIKTMVMPSEIWADLVGDTISNYKYTEVVDSVFYTENVPIFGRRMLVADVPALTSDLSSSYYDEYYMLGLGAGGITCRITHMGATETERVITGEVPYSLFRKDFTVEIGLSGLKWAGGINPTTAALATAGNWDEDYEDHRDCELVKGVFHSYNGGTEVS